MFTGMAGIGFNRPTARPRLLAAAAGYAGVMYRLDGGLTRIGAVLTLYLPAGVAGPAARLVSVDVAVAGGVDSSTRGCTSGSRWRRCWISRALRQRAGSDS
jgi:hypothetical protein